MWICSCEADGRIFLKASTFTSNTIMQRHDRHSRFPLARKNHHRNNPGSYAGLTPETVSHVEVKTDGIRCGCAYIPDPLTAYLVIAKAHRSPFVFEGVLWWDRPLLLQSKWPPVARMIWTVESCRKSQRIISTDCWKREACYLIPAPRQFQRGRPVKVAAFFIATSISVESMHSRCNGHRHQGDADHKHSQIHRIKTARWDSWHHRRRELRSGTAPASPRARSYPCRKRRPRLGENQWSRRKRETEAIGPNSSP